MTLEQLAHWLDHVLNWRWTARSLAGAGLLMLATIGCGPAPLIDRARAPAPPVQSEPEASVVPAPAIPPGEHIRTERGTTVDINPPGGGIHVNVPPGPNGPGTRVDVGPNGVNVQ